MLKPSDAEPLSGDGFFLEALTHRRPTTGAPMTVCTSSREVRPKVWKLLPRIRKKWRKLQGIIFGKRCGVTQNIGRAARHRGARC